ncbi:MAG: hypothetical protein HYY45_07275, partial [Deltaproteobacteria bacterium]|nr:hypothetical protein [Deltaproteobacteria bacterium]
MKNSLCLRKAVLGAFVIAAVFFSRASLAAEVTGASTQKVVQNYGKLVLAFEANQGQTNGQVKFLSHGKGYTLFLTPTEAVLKGTSTLRMELVGARRDSRMVGLELLPGKSNYLIGKDPNKWKRNIPSYARVKQEGVYPGIDVVYYGNQGELEYDFIVAPGADPKAINLVFHEADRAAVDADGSLVLQVASSEVKFRRPVVYQERDGVRTPIAAGYILNPKSKIENRATVAHNRSPKSLSVGFQVAAYDHARPLVIDPV